jgi:hypothetical protein
MGRAAVDGGSLEQVIVHTGTSPDAVVVRLAAAFV